MSRISVKDAVKRYGNNTVIPDLNLEIGDGELFTLLGPSGCGKTTLLRMIAGFNSIEGGDIFFNEKRINDMDPSKRNIGMVFQNYAIFPNLSVRDNVAFGLKNRKVDKAEIKKRTDEFLNLMQIMQYADRMPNQLSGGQQQRIALARALVISPDVLLMDEPLSNLDAKLRLEMRYELQRLHVETGSTFVYVTHDQEEALTMSDTVVVMSGGKIQQIGSPQDIYNEPKNAFVARFIGDSNIVDGVMLKDFLVNFGGHDFTCVDRGFKVNEPVQVVIRPEDVQIVPPSVGMLTGLVREVIFKGVHFEMHVDVEGYEWIIHSTQASQPGELIGMNIGPDEIHIMKRSEV